MLSRARKRWKIYLSESRSMFLTYIAPRSFNWDTQRCPTRTDKLKIFFKVLLHLFGQIRNIRPHREYQFRSLKLQFVGRIILGVFTMNGLYFFCHRLFVVRLLTEICHRNPSLSTIVAGMAAVFGDTTPKITKIESNENNGVFPIILPLCWCVIRIKNG